MNEPNEHRIPETRRRATATAVAWVIAGLAVAFIAGTVIGGAASALARRPADAPQTPAVAASPVPAIAPETAVLDAIRRANLAQARALAARDASVMRDTATDAYYDELVRTLADLRRGGVTDITLAQMRVGHVSVDGSSATAVTYETWRSTFADGSTDQRTDENDYRLVLDGGSWRIASDVQPPSATSRGGTPPGIAPPAAQPPATARGSSRNWSGYVATGGSFTSVTGTWIVPQVAATSSGVDATWVGIGGVSGRDLIQAGTEAAVEGGEVSYDAWIEMLPQGTQTVRLAVTAGDLITTTLTETSAGTWQITIVNNTSGKSFSTTVRYASSLSSAEWVEEAPSGGRRILPLDDFGAVRFSAASAVEDGKSVSAGAAGAKPVTMIDGAGRAIARPSALGADGASFTVTRIG